MSGSFFPKPGDLFEDRYRIASVIGSGGFARVVLAHDVELDRRVALKILKIAQAPGNVRPDVHMAAMVERFRREARLVAKLRDPHTITMFDHGQTARGLLYMVCEYVDGKTLREVVDEQAPVAAARVVHIMEQALASLQEAHAFGVLHRDIKPANIMLYEHIGRTDQVKVLDFGIAKSILGEATKTALDLTGDGKIIGTPRYMSPEQLRGEGIGPTADIYSLGLVAYELLTGERANDADSTINIITRQVTSPSFRLSDQIDIPTGLRTIVDGMLIKNVDHRFQSADEVLEALTHWKQPSYQGPGEARAENSSTVDLSQPNTIMLEPRTAEMQAYDPNAHGLNARGTDVYNPSVRDRFAAAPGADAPTQARRRKGVVWGAVIAAVALGVGAWFVVRGEPSETDVQLERAPSVKAASNQPVPAVDDEPLAPDVEVSGVEVSEAAVAVPPGNGNEENGAREPSPSLDEDVIATSEETEPTRDSDDEQAATAQVEPTAQEAKSAPAKPKRSPAKQIPAPVRRRPAPVKTRKPAKAETKQEKKDKPSFFDVTGGSL